MRLSLGWAVERRHTNRTAEKSQNLSQGGLEAGSGDSGGSGFHNRQGLLLSCSRYALTRGGSIYQTNDGGQVAAL